MIKSEKIDTPEIPLNPTIYLDMDEVFASFLSHYIAYGDNIGQNVRPPYNDSSQNPELFRKAVIEYEIFSKLEPMPGMFDLVSHLLKIQKQYNFKMEMLSSLNAATDELVIAGEQQKRAWLSKFSIPWKPNFVRHHTQKAKYATGLALLIDDNPACTIPFTENGGLAVQYSGFTPEFIAELDQKIALMLERESRLKAEQKEIA